MAEPKLVSIKLVPSFSGTLVDVEGVAVKWLYGNQFVHAVSVQVDETELADLVVEQTADFPLPVLASHVEDAFRSREQQCIIPVDAGLEHPVVAPDLVIDKLGGPGKAGFVERYDIKFAALRPVGGFRLELAAGCGEKPVPAFLFKDVAAMCEGECHSLGSLPDLAGTAVHEDARLHSDERREKAHDGVEKVGMARNGDEAHDSAGASVDKAGSACLEVVHIDGRSSLRSGAYICHTVNCKCIGGIDGLDFEY